jgi:hypothetical protein
MNGPTMLLTTLAPENSSVSAVTSCSTSTTSWSTSSMPGTLSSTAWTRALSRPAATNGTLSSRRYSQTSRPV